MFRLYFYIKLKLIKWINAASKKDYTSSLPCQFLVTKWWRWVDCNRLYNQRLCMHKQNWLKLFYPWEFNKIRISPKIIWQHYRASSWKPNDLDERTTLKSLSTISTLDKTANSKYCKTWINLWAEPCIKCSRFISQHTHIGCLQRTKKRF